YSREADGQGPIASLRPQHQHPLLDFTLSPSSATGRTAGDWNYSPTAQVQHPQEGGPHPRAPSRATRQLFRPSSARPSSAVDRVSSEAATAKPARPSSGQAATRSSDAHEGLSSASLFRTAQQARGRSPSPGPSRGRSPRPVSGINSRPTRPASPSWNASRQQTLAIDAHGPSSPQAHLQPLHQSWTSPQGEGSTRDPAHIVGIPNHAVGVRCQPWEQQPSPQRSASGFASQPATVRHYLSNMINAPIPSAQSPVKRPTRRQDPEAVPSGCFSPSKWASTRSSADERNPGSNPCSNSTAEGSSPNKRPSSARSSVEDRNPSSIPSSATLSARSELTPAGTPYATPHGTPTKPGTAAGTRNGAGISINELIRSAREGVPPPQAARAVRHAVSHPSSPAAAAQAAATDRLPGYSIGKTIGEGGFCKVRMGVHDISGQQVAIKVIDKLKLKVSAFLVLRLHRAAEPCDLMLQETVDQRRIQREISILRRLSHGSIIQLLEIVETEHFIFLVMELAQGGSLLDYVRQRKRLAEPEACFFLQQIVHGLMHCHDMEIVHRDVKLENILLDASNRIKLIDFGLAANTMPGKKLKVHCGSPSYAAPEIVARQLYDGPPVDVWSLGVVLYGMICGHLPFHASDNKKELCQKIIKGVYNTPAHISSEVKDLLARMLTVVPDHRITFEQVCSLFMYAKYDQSSMMALLQQR
ncbi:MAG: serine threonine kinase, partial [Trebouxia sp. A1-2]